MEHGQNIVFEVCADSITSVISAVEGGFISHAKKCVNIPIHVLIRPRSGDFCYTEHEVQIMEQDIKNCIDIGVDGFVIGALTRSGEVDIEICKRLLDITKKIPVTFHRAFDLASDPFQALECIMGLECSAILTSGQAHTALAGLPLIQNLIEKASNKIDIIAGCGITCNNLRDLLSNSDVQVFHSSAKSVLQESSSASVVQGAAAHSVVNKMSVLKMRNIADEIAERRHLSKGRKE